MFNKVLVANRGEVALRVIRACKELGIKTVAVHSDVDVDSIHVRLADEAVCIGPAPSQASYLNVPRIISAAEITDAEAIHPGYGYLAESPEFSEICASCGIKFIGPRTENIRIMGDKVRAREIMAEHGLPTIPVIIKARAGGGGKGMRIVNHPDDFESAFRMAKSEAAASFCDGRIYLEKFLPKCRHVEFQIMADGRGGVVHLGERDCSVQRRHQKVLEESPSPGINEKLRAEIGSRCVKALKELGYSNVGTLEFLITPNGDYYFIEMNTRIQVEHPVTEAITGIDLVKAQIRLAAGEPLPFSQKEIKLSGHAIECRINAENPITFESSPGKITFAHFPGGPGVRVDSAAFQDCKVLPFYDSLIAKIIVVGEDRQEALTIMKRALGETVISGIMTTVPLFTRILDEPDFRRGKVWIDYLETHPSLFQEKSETS